jgi:hypothetical protein
MKKLIMLFLLLTAVSFSQVKPNAQYVKGGLIYAFKWTDVDSTETVYSEYFDVSMFDANTLVAWVVVDGTGTVDSLTLVTIEGQYPPLPTDGNTSYVTGLVVDTLATNKVTGIQTNIGTAYNQTVQKGAFYDTVFVPRTEPPARVFPEWRLKVQAADLTVSGYDMVVRIYIYGKQNDNGVDPKAIRQY